MKMRKREAKESANYPPWKRTFRKVFIIVGVSYDFSGCVHDSVTSGSGIHRHDPAYDYGKEYRAKVI